MSDTPVFSEVEVALKPLVKSSQRSGGIAALTIAAARLVELSNTSSQLSVKDVIDLLDRVRQDIVNKGDWIDSHG